VSVTLPSTGSPVVTVTGLSGTLTLATAGVFGAFEGSLTLNVPGLTLGVQQLALAFNSTTSSHQVSIDLDDNPATVETLQLPPAPAPPVVPSVAWAATGAPRTIGEFVLVGAFSFRKASAETPLPFANVAVALPTSVTPVLSLSAVGGTVTVSTAGTFG